MRCLNIILSIKWKFNNISLYIYSHQRECLADISNKDLSLNIKQYER